MFISKLSSIIEEYDRYGEHRINGVKAVFVLFMLFLVNMVYTIPNPYFNYFYIPMTAISAEVIGDSVKNKYLMFFYTSIGATISAFLFNITIIYPLFFLFFVFFYSLGLYLIAINFMKNLLVPVPIILSLAIYSLLYGEVSTDFYVALNNSLVSLLAIVVIMVSILFFPLSYYFRAWLRAFVLMLKQILGNFEMIRDNQEMKIELAQPHLIMMVRFARLLPRKLPIFNILKINLLMNDLRLLSSIPKYPINIEDTIIGIRRLIEAVEKNEACPAYISNPNFLNKIINTWNGICYRI